MERKFYNIVKKMKIVQIIANKYIKTTFFCGGAVGAPTTLAKEKCSNNDAFRD